MDWTSIVTILVAVITSSGVWGYLDHRRQEKRADRGLEDAERRLIVAIARSQLVQQSIEYIKRGSVSVEEVDALTALYEPYRELKGNGNAERLYKQAVDLPVRHGRTEERQ